MSAVRQRDPDADLFESTSRRLEEWGSFCRSRTLDLGLPTISNFAQTAAHVRRQEREDRKHRRLEIRTRVKSQRKAGGLVDCKEVAQAAGHVELDVSANGKETRSLRSPAVIFSSEASKVEAVVRSLPKWMQTPIYRTYLYLQPHRIAARDLRMDEADYRSRWKQAVREVGKLLAMRESGAVK